MAPGAAAVTAAWMVATVAGQRADLVPTTVAPAGAGAGAAAEATPAVVTAQTIPSAPARTVVRIRPPRIAIAPHVPARPDRTAARSLLVTTRARAYTMG
ncbi:hypothetical protein GCM10023201_05230 [Actinomycetospora corticicola]